MHTSLLLFAKLLFITSAGMLPPRERAHRLNTYTPYAVYSIWVGDCRRQGSFARSFARSIPFRIPSPGAVQGCRQIPTNSILVCRRGLVQHPSCLESSTGLLFPCSGIGKRSRDVISLGCLLTGHCKKEPSLSIVC